VAAGFGGITVADPNGMDWVVKKTRAKFQKKKRDEESGKRLLRIESAIRAIPRGKVSTYGGIARIAGFPGAARLVARVLHRGFGLPWQRVLGAGGEIKLRGDSAMEQRFRLEAEGVRFRGRKVDMKQCEWKFGRAGRGRQEPTNPPVTFD
jgi:methylated-DNA-protein-cysteine methyltransferase related protein